MASAWETFVANAVDWLRGASLSHGAGQGFPDEQALTQYLALGLRKEFMEHFGLEADSAALPGHIPFRDGPTPEDKAAWAASQDDKWIAVHGVNFVPDILIRQTPGKSGPVLPVEVKLLKTSGGQGFATAIGQALIYSARYGRARHLRRRGDRGFHRQEAVFFSSQGQWARNSWRAWLRRVSRSS